MSKAQLILEKLLVPTSDAVRLKRHGFSKVTSTKETEDGGDIYRYRHGPHHIIHYPKREEKKQYFSVTKSDGKSKQVSHPNMHAAVRRIKRTLDTLSKKE